MVVVLLLLLLWLVLVFWLVVGGSDINVVVVRELMFQSMISQNFDLVKFPHKCPMKYCLQYDHTKN